MGQLTPKEYQIKGAEFWVKRKRAYYAMDMGMGKTFTTLLALKEINQPALIIAPIRTIYSSWPEEIAKAGLGQTYSIVHGRNKYEALITKADIYLTNFESIGFIYKYISDLLRQKRQLPFSVCVIDEGSMIKSSDTKRFRYLKAMRNIFPEYRLILSGTPAPNSLEDLWSQYFWLTDGAILERTITAYRNKYFNHVRQIFKYTIKEGAAEKIYKEIAPITYRLDAKDYLKLPKVIKNEIVVELPKRLQQDYKDFEKDFFMELDQAECEAFNAASLSMKLRQFIQGAVYYQKGDLTRPETVSRETKFLHTLKYDVLKEIVETSPSPVLATIQFKFELEIAKKMFPDVKYIAGGISAKQSAEYIAQWNKGEIPLLLCHPASLSHGVNMQSGGHTIVWSSMTWSLEQYLQFNARLRRPGQEYGVVINHILMKDTLDYKVYDAIANKNMNQRALLDYLRTFKHD